MNQPYQRANHDSTWNGIAIGAGAGMGMAGATHGVFAAKDAYSNKKYQKRIAASGAIPMGVSGPPDQSGILKGAARSKMFGGRFGWRGAATYAGAGILGGAIGMGADYMTD